MSKYTYMTVLTNEYYLNGAIALKRCLNDVGSRYPLNVLVPKGREDLANLLSFHGISCIEADMIDLSFEIENSAEYEYWKETFFKLEVAGQTGWDKIVMLDCDLLINENIDQLFEYPHMSAVVSGGLLHPEYKKLNSGVVVIEPSAESYEKLIAGIKPAYDYRKSMGMSCGDQDVFHYVWKEWEMNPELKIDETYNTYIHDAGKMFSITGSIPKVVHFTGAKKPWSYNIVDDILTFTCRSFVDKNFVRYKLLKKYKKYTKVII